ncbi:MAG: hypothetical protein KVP17_003594 [Porospora cf. gigantea B]|uniref:uncharacterized protein n=1 Tax=Porospora cf. gigantea B TaxID=2853592 RepID=UPI003571C7B2|nr:MAG: hypothetical protein KVP17_003594 [Porospora cf. gigantea B]
MVTHHAALQERTEDIKAIRKQHQKFSETVGTVLRGDSRNLAVTLGRELQKAFEVFGFDVLDCSPAGKTTWDSALKVYEERVGKVETQIGMQLQQRLAGASSSTEMFRVFSEFNAIFFRKKIRAAIQHYQAQLLQQVKEDLRLLQVKCDSAYEMSDGGRISRLKSVPVPASELIWSTQVESRVATSLRRIENVLGPSWKQHLDGQKLRQDGESFQAKLNVSSLFDQWLARNKTAHKFDLSNPVFVVYEMGPGNYEVRVNMDDSMLNLYKEIRYLHGLNFRVPYAIRVTADDTRAFYPYVVWLRQCLRSFNQASYRLELPEHAALRPLIAKQQREILGLIRDNMKLTFQSNDVDAVARALSDAVTLFEGKLEDAREYRRRGEQLLLKLLTAKVAAEDDSPTIVSTLEELQAVVTDVATSNFSNVDQWASQLNQRIADVLLKRLNETLDLWVQEFTGFSTKSSPQLVRSRQVLEFQIRSQTLVLEPPVEAARAQWTSHLHTCMSHVCGLSRLRVGGRVVGGEEGADSTFRFLLSRMHQESYMQCVGAIRNSIEGLSRLAGTWSRYQRLWEEDVSSLTTQMGTDLAQWQNLLNDIKSSRQSVHTEEEVVCLGPLVVNQSTVLQKVSSKFDSWHRECLQAFGNRVRETCLAMQTQIRATRGEMELLADSNRSNLNQVESNATSMSPEATVALTEYMIKLDSIQLKVLSWSPDVDHLVSSERLLERQRFVFPNDWVWADQLTGDWEAFLQIFRLQHSSIERLRPALTALAQAADGRLAEELSALHDEWIRTKPTSSQESPTSALLQIERVRKSLLKLKQEFEGLAKARESLCIVGQSGVDPDGLLSEIESTREVWCELQKFYATLSALKEEPWLSVVPRKVRIQLEEVNEAIRAVPAIFRQHEAFESLSEQVTGYLGTNALLNELKTDALKERHWKKLFSACNMRVDSVSAMTLGDIWDTDMYRYEQAISEILLAAQGENAVEEFLKELKTTWFEYELQLIAYKEKCYLIKGFDDVTSLLDDHLSSLQSMKLSPYYRRFEEDATLFDDKLSNLNSLLAVWAEVQRKYVYLEGVFLGSADIAALLPSELSRFKSIDHDFVAITKRTVQRPRAMELVQQEGLLRTLERLSESLTRVQKALTEYLEKQRSLFPRFYFVGDEDLLEIIGNSRDPLIVQRHIKKMFAGVDSFVLDGTVVLGIASKEGEEVTFLTPVEVQTFKSLDAWLKAVETQMVFTLASILSGAMESFSSMDVLEADSLFRLIDETPLQILLLAFQVRWTSQVDACLSAGKPLLSVVNQCESLLALVAQHVLSPVEPIFRTKLVQIMTEVVHERDVVRSLVDRGVTSPDSFHWLKTLRFYFDPRGRDVMDRVTVRMANAKLTYGFEYLGLAEKLVQTDLTDSCFLTLTQALHFGMGGNPFGPAGTGKTESVKALGAQLGRFVLVFCCDETFDFHAMGRIFVGLCEVGAWGCFDEFNRLEERILSAVSEQILTIQAGIKEKKSNIALIGHNVGLNSNVGIFVTMNPGYAGRSQLPDNLKQLFRECAMIKPDKAMIGQVCLYSNGFLTAEALSSKAVSLFDLCLQQLSKQPHYDFGLRALKSVLTTAGTLKRKRIEELDKENVDLPVLEKEILLRAIMDTLLPRLVPADVPLLKALVEGVFPESDVGVVDEAQLTREVLNVCQYYNYDCSDSWLEKILQLHQILRVNHGVMLVGPSGTGKTSAWTVLLQALEQLDGVKSQSYVLDPKAVPKDELYGKLDPTTMEWTDGVFTSFLRRILNEPPSVSKNKRYWIVMDGDVDPEWAENLNSALDENKILTLPTGERLQISSNVRLMFEVDTLKSATLATVSRCGMIWFSEDVLSLTNVANHIIETVCKGQEDRREVMLMLEKPTMHRKLSSAMSFQAAESSLLGSMQEDKHTLNSICATTLKGFFKPDGIALQCVELSQKYEHVMEFTKIRVLNATLLLIPRAIAVLEEYYAGQTPNRSHLRTYISRYLVLALVWGCGGAMPLKDRNIFAVEVARVCSEVGLPSELDGSTSLLEYEVLSDGNWAPWRECITPVEIGRDGLSDAQLVIDTVDTVRHKSVLGSWLEMRLPFILCGPPGSGKTMTFLSALKAVHDVEIASLNFSSGTSPEVLLKTFDLYCEYVKTSQGLVLRPNQPGKWLMVFCDEVNLPAPDKYETQRVIMFMRQLQELGGFYKLDKFGQWVFVKLERIQFGGCCNPPTDAGRHPMSPRYLRHAPIIFVDFPGAESLEMIYGTFNRALLQPFSALRDCARELTLAMVEFYTANQERFTADQQPHYIYSPRELTRWKVALHEALFSRSDVSVRELVRLAIHEALRIWRDRLVEVDSRQWTDATIDAIFLRHFPSLSETDVARPLLFTSLMTRHYEEADQESLRDFVQGRMKLFNEEVSNTPLVLFDDCLEHIVRIDRVLRQPLGHLLLVGASGAGKTILSRFISWMNGISVFIIKAGRNYSTEAFEVDLRSVMRRAGLKDEKITFIFDESNALGPAFLERMNALLAAGEVPGLFEGEEWTQLMSECRAAFRQLSDENELFAKFTRQIQRNLHIVFTMNPSNPDFYNRQATSPALFNRCIIDWFGDWNHDALIAVAQDFNKTLEVAPEAFEEVAGDESSLRRVLAETIVRAHYCTDELNKHLLRNGQKSNYVTPRDYLDFLRHFLAIVCETKEETIETSRHLAGGLSKLHETNTQVSEFQKVLSVKSQELLEKNQEAEDKMKMMIQQQTEAEESKKHAEKLAQKLDASKVEIAHRKKEVGKELKDVEPLLLTAQSDVKDIPKRMLVELVSLGSPPAAVKFAVEAVIIFLNDLGDKSVAWDECRKAMKTTDFISRVLNFDASSSSPATVRTIQNKFLSSPGWDYDKIMRASKAAGPLAKWVESSVSYQTILLKVAPLREEINDLEAATIKNEKKFRQTKDLLADLERQLVEYKSEYAELISQVQRIKTEMETVEAKVTRSTQLLANLESEQKRWTESVKSSADALNTVLGDSLLAAAFCTYTGFFEHGDRERLLQEWRAAISGAGLRIRGGLSLVELLSRPQDRFQWQSNSLPSDALSIENAVIMKRYIRYPLVIDPSGQGTGWLLKQYKDQKLVQTSFNDPSFIKHLESALRFGTTLLVQDVEKVSPLINNVLNKETHRAGGRTLITVGDTEVDFSPTFKIILATKDPTVVFTPDLCSRVTFINFTITPSSLLNQCVNMALASERPEVEKERNDVLKLQGEFRVVMRDLEDKLLHSLSNIQGNILDDDKVLSTLESLKAQADEVEREVHRTEEVMEAVSDTTNTYVPLAEACSRAYFTLQQLHNLFFLYHYDLRSFHYLFGETLKSQKSPAGLSSAEYQSRMRLITVRVLRSVYKHVAAGMLDKHKLIVALELMRIKFESLSDVTLRTVEFDALMGLQTTTGNVIEVPLELNEEQRQNLSSLTQIPIFRDLDQHIASNADAWRTFASSAEPEGQWPPDLIPETDPMLQSRLTERCGKDTVEEGQVLLRSVRQALLLRAVRPDRLHAHLGRLAESIVGKGFLESAPVDAAAIKSAVEREVTADVPMVLISTAGFDPSHQVVAAAKQLQKNVFSVAMGSDEGFSAASTSLQQAARDGSWVLLKNAHLCPSWLAQFDKTFLRQQHHSGFRVFFTMEFNEKVPSNFLRLSFKAVFEAPPGIQASMKRTLKHLLPSLGQDDSTPAARYRLQFTLAFLHALVVERKQFHPIGWTKPYEFSDADLVCGFSVIDQWLKIGAQGKPALDPSALNWDAIRTILKNTVYGGRLDNQVDLSENMIRHTFRHLGLVH